MATLHEVITTTPELAGLTYPQIAEWLNAAPLVPNPVTEPPLVPAPVTFGQVMALVPDAEAAKAYNMDGFVGHVEKATELGDRLWLAKLLGIALASQTISEGTAQALAGLLTAQVPDPTWSAQIPGAPRWQAAGLAGPVSAADVQAAVHGG